VSEGSCGELPSQSLRKNLKNWGVARKIITYMGTFLGHQKHKCIAKSI
jgi:hypothetical protein